MARRSVSLSAEGGDHAAAATYARGLDERGRSLEVGESVASVNSTSPRGTRSREQRSSLSPVSRSSQLSPGRPRSRTRSSVEGSPGAERIATGVRLRPQLPRERGGGRGCVSIDPPSQVTLRDPQGKRSFAFGCDFAFDSSDSELPGHADQAAVYRSVGTQIVERAVQGFNCCLCSYGQTGTGKTHTLHGDWSSIQQRGLLPRVAEALLGELGDLRASGAEAQVRVSYLEIYNNRLFDLLAPAAARQLGGKGRGRLDIHTHPTIGVYVDNLSELPVKDFTDIERLVALGGRSKHTAATSMNARSSRSHTIFSMNIEVRNASEGERNRMAAVQVVDLAGRESEQTSECTGERFQELKFINQSLFHLAKCINALSAGTADHIPFRDSKLTLLLSESFQRNSWTVLLATLTPSATSFDENLLTCRFLESTGRIATQPVPNGFSAEDLQVQLQREIVQMQQQLQQGEPGHIPILLKSSQLLLDHVRLSWSRAWPVPEQPEADARVEEASARAGRMLGSAAVHLKKVERANDAALAALGRADSRLSAVEATVEEMRRAPQRATGNSLSDLSSSPELKPASSTTRLPALAPHAASPHMPTGVTFSTELPPVISC